jgi:hypothetical protein
MEEMKMKRSAAIVATFAALFAVMSIASQAQAGASASAPSKHQHSSQVASQGNSTAITEYSSSSRRSH